MNISPNVNAFTAQVTKDLHLQKKSSRNTNLNFKLRKALQGLQNDQQLVIKPADKGGNTVVMDSTQYQTMCLKILNNTEWYAVSSHKALEKAHNRLTNIILDAHHEGIIDED